MPNSQTADASENRTPLEYALSIWQDTRGDTFTREEAGKIADEMSEEVMHIPCNLSEEFIEGWEAACETVAMALRFREFHF